MLNHFYNLSQNLVTSIIKFLINVLTEIVVPVSNLYMNLGLGSFGFCFTPSQRRHAPRRPADPSPLPPLADPPTRFPQPAEPSLLSPSEVPHRSLDLGLGVN
jgi:hypothetical protein